MQFSTALPIQYFVDRYNLKLVGENNLLVTGLNEIHKVKSGDITFVDVEKYYKKSIFSEATVIIIDKETDVPEGKALLICDNPFQVYNQIAIDFKPFRPQAVGMIHTNIKVGENTIIEPNVTICDNVIIGDNCYIQSGAYIGCDTVVGDSVIIQAGSLIGTDAFYFKKENGKYIKWHSCGRVLLENDVVIGAGCTVNRGVSGDTIVGEGTKLDSQVHLGHGVVVGKNCLIAAQVGIAGKTIIGDDVVIYGQVGIAQNLRIGNGVVILAKSGVSKNLEGNKVYFGYPATEAREKYKELAALRILAKSGADQQVFA